MEVINLNFIPSGANPVAHASQFDEGRTTRFNLFDGSAVYTLDGTEIITVSVRKPDGHIVTESVTNTSSTYLEVVTTEQMTACAGDNLAQIKVEKGGDTIGFLNYILSVQKDPEDGGDPSASFIHDLEQQIADAVADQYDSNAVIFDAAPVPGHGVGYAVTSEGVKNAIDGAIAGLTIPEELDDLTDVVITGPTDGDILVYQNGEWVNIANPASTANFAADYDATATYNTGDKCIYNNLLYICNTDNTTGTWDPSAWDFTPVGDWDASNIPLGSDFSDPNSTATAIGDLSQLTTSVTSSLVGAVNEVNSGKVNVSDLTPKTFSTTTPISIQANETITQQFTVNNAKYGIITGFAITSNLNVVALQFYFYNATTVQVRVKNVSNVNDVFHISFFYI